MYFFKNVILKENQLQPNSIFYLHFSKYSLHISNFHYFSSEIPICQNLQKIFNIDLLLKV